MLHISDAEKSETENRLLATKPDLFINSTINEKYGTQFDTWFNDRFNGRDTFIDIFSSIKYHTNNIYQNDKALLVKRNGWMFNDNNFCYPEYFDDIISNFKNFNDFCEKHNMKLYVLLVPDKKIIYSDILDEFNGVNHKKIDDFQRYVADVQKSVPNNTIIYPYQELWDAKEKDFVFFKQSHHWTDWGAYIGYKSLAQRIRKDFKRFKIVSLDDYDRSVSNKIRDDWGRSYNVGHTTRLLNLSNKADDLLDVEYNYYDNKRQNLITQDVQEYIKTYQNKDKSARYKVFLTGNSQNEDLLQFLPYSVKSLKYLRLNNSQKSNEEQSKFMKYYKQELLDYKPNIVIISVSSVYFQSLMKDFYKD